MKIPCKNCGFTENYEPKYMEQKVICGDINNGKEHFFNLDLWLQKEYKGKLFWATNYKHLEYIKEYVQSKIRKRLWLYRLLLEYDNGSQITTIYKIR